MIFTAHIHKNSFLTAKQLRAKYNHKKMSEHLVALYVAHNTYLSERYVKDDRIAMLRESNERLKDIIENTKK